MATNYVISLHLWLHDKLRMREKNLHNQTSFTGIQRECNFHIHWQVCIQLHSVILSVPDGLLKIDLNQISWSEALNFTLISASYTCIERLCPETIQMTSP